MIEPNQLLFYVIIAFFVLIGLSSLLVLLGYVKAPDKAFRKWAVTGFAATVTATVVWAFKLDVAPPPEPIVVALRTAEGTTIPKLKSGQYFRYDEFANAKTTPEPGGVVPALGEGGWQVRLPGNVSNKVIQLVLRDEDGGSWETGPFYPNYVRQEVRAGKTTAPASTRWETPGVAVLLAAERGEQGSLPARTVRLNNYARRIADRYDRPYYEWRVFVDESPAVLAAISRVDYALHPTFPNPFQSSSDRANQFELRSAGWGSFTVAATIRYSDGRQARISYLLDVGKPWPAAAQRRNP